MQTLQQCPSFQMAATRVSRQGGERAKMTRAHRAQLITCARMHAFPFKMLNTCPSLAGQTCVLTPRDAAHRGQDARNVKRVPSTSKQLANNISLAATPRNPDQDWTFCEHKSKHRSNTTNTNTELRQDSH